MPHRLRRLDGHHLPDAAGLGRVLRPRAGRRDGRGHRRHHAGGRNSPGPVAGPRRDQGPALGTDRGDHRRGSLPGRLGRDGVRPRPAVGRHPGHAEAFRRVLGLPGRAQHGPGSHRRPRVRRHHPSAVRDGAPGRRAVGHAVLHRHRRGPGIGRPRAADRAAAGHAGFRRPGRLGLLRDRVPADPARGGLDAWSGRRAGPGGGPGRRAAQHRLLRPGAGRRGAGRPGAGAVGGPRRSPGAAPEVRPRPAGSRLARARRA